jgi:hypothetical protein
MLSKSLVMKRAWQLYKVGGVRKYFTYTTSWGSVEEQSYLVQYFSECLKRALEIEKEALNHKDYDINKIMAGMSDYISSAYASGQYMGD